MPFVSRIILIITLAVFSAFQGANNARAELIATEKKPKLTLLNPMRNGLSSLTLTWPIDDLAYNRVLSLGAGLTTVITGGTADQNAFDTETFIRINSIGFNVSVEGRALMLTMTAPHDTFSLGLEHLNKVLTNQTFETKWYQRELVRQAPRQATKTRRADSVLGTVSGYLNFPVSTDGTDTTTLTYRFGMPEQIIMRTPDKNTDPLVETTVRNLPYRPVALLAKNAPEDSLDLPQGVIFAHDPAATEMMILLVKRQKYQTEAEQIASNLLMDYIGSYQGSEMFRIIRQEMRAAYDPKSDFLPMGKNEALLSLSATVLAEEWPKTLDTMRQIYDSARKGDVTKQGMNNVLRRLRNIYQHQFVTNATWTAKNFLREYPTGTDGEVFLLLFGSLFNTSIAGIPINARQYLPPFDDYLLILIGAGPEPDGKLLQKGMCRLPLNEKLRFCIEALRSAQ